MVMLVVAGRGVYREETGGRGGDAINAIITRALV